MSSRADSVRDAVAVRRPVDARERASIEELVSELDRLASPFDDEADLTHVTASAIVTGARGVVLHLHKRMGIWLQPGGHVDPDEEPADAALREAREETGLPVALMGRSLAHVDVHAGPRGHRHLDLRYLVAAEDVEPDPPDHESQDVRWFSWSDAIALAEPGLEGALRAMQPGEPVLRPAAAEDAAVMAHAFLRSRIFATPEIPNLHDEADVTGWITGRIEHDDAWVADVDGVVVAEMILARPPDSDGPMHLDHLYLDPAWMGRGLGDRMLALADERSGGALELWTHQVNSGARRFYERHGFVAVETTDGTTNEERLPDVRYLRTR